MENQFKDFNEIEFQKVIRISDSLSFDDVQEDTDYLNKLILKHHPNGEFRLIEEHKIKERGIEEPVIAIQLPKFVIEFHAYLYSKYLDRIYANAVSRKVFSVFFTKIR